MTHPDNPFATPVFGQLEVSLDVPNLHLSIGFYTTLFDAPPLAAERRAAWFDVPGSVLRIELREASCPTATQLRLCTEPRRLRTMATRLSHNGVATAKTGLTRDGHPRAISFRDPGHNRWEMYTPIDAAPSPWWTAHDLGGTIRRFPDRVRATFANGSVEARFQHQRRHDQTLLLRHGFRTTINDG